MENNFRIRAASEADKTKIHHLIRESIAREKSLLSPAHVCTGFMEEFIDKAIRKGHIMVVENKQHEVELIGQVHFYNTRGRAFSEDESLKEFSFFSGTDSSDTERATELVNWLFGEIQLRHRDVFRVKISTPVCSQDSMKHFREMGLEVEGKYQLRLKGRIGKAGMVGPLSWYNPTFN